jgi:hypothetical protein
MSLPQNLWTSEIIKRRLLQEAGFECRYGIPEKKQYWIVAPEADTGRGKHVLMNFKPSFMDIEPHNAQQQFALMLQAVVQFEAGHDGLWLVGWTHPPTTAEAVRVDGDNAWGRLVMLWLDSDGDPKFVAESDLPFADMVEHGVEYYCGMAEQSYAQFNEMVGAQAMKADFGIKEEQQTKAVLGSLH